jgi:hypothetical protein
VKFVGINCLDILSSSKIMVEIWSLNKDFIWFWFLMSLTVKERRREFEEQRMETPIVWPYYGVKVKGQLNKLCLPWAFDPTIIVLVYFPTTYLTRKMLGCWRIEGKKSSISLRSFFIRCTLAPSLSHIFSPFVACCVATHPITVNCMIN